LKPSANIPLETETATPDRRDDQALQMVLQSALKNRAVAAPTNPGTLQAYWPASHFGLDRVTIFRDAGEAEQAAILAGCSRDLLAESYFIEKSGMAFAAKMALLAERDQERMLYSLFGADEAIHFNWVSQYISGETVAGFNDNPFIQLLDEILRGDDRLILAYLVQVVLEGWGLGHYQSLMRDCFDAGLKAIFEQIIRDEARHHAGGVILFNTQPPSSQQLTVIINTLQRLLWMVQVGPQAVAAQVERVAGSLSVAQREQLFAELDCEQTTARKLATLKSLMRSAASADCILDALERSGAFRPFSATECAALQG
jgi:hypothetical protein